MFPILNKSHVAETAESPAISSKIPEIKESGCILTSVRNLRDEVSQDGHEGLYLAFLAWLKDTMDYQG